MHEPTQHTQRMYVQSKREQEQQRKLLRSKKKSYLVDTQKLLETWRKKNFDMLHLLHNVPFPELALNNDEIVNWKSFGGMPSQYIDVDELLSSCFKSSFLLILLFNFSLDKSYLVQHEKRFIFLLSKSFLSINFA